MTNLSCSPVPSRVIALSAPVSLGLTEIPCPLLKKEEPTVPAGEKTIREAMLPIRLAVLWFVLGSTALYTDQLSEKYTTGVATCDTTCHNGTSIGNSFKGKSPRSIVSALEEMKNTRDPLAFDPIMLDVARRFPKENLPDVGRYFAQKNWKKGPVDLKPISTNGSGAELFDQHCGDCHDETDQTSENKNRIIEWSANNGEYTFKNPAMEEARVKFEKIAGWEDKLRDIAETHPSDN